MENGHNKPIWWYVIKIKAPNGIGEAEWVRLYGAWDTQRGIQLYAEQNGSL